MNAFKAKSKLSFKYGFIFKHKCLKIQDLYFKKDINVRFTLAANRIAKKAYNEILTQAQGPHIITNACLSGS